MILRALSVLALCAAALPAADAGKVFNGQLSSLEREFVPAVEAMPADKFDFAPKKGAFDTVRTFGLEAKHAAFVLNEISAAMLGEKNPSMTGPNENGPDSLKSKDEIVKYVKDAFAYAHRAMSTLANDNLMTEVADPFDPKSKSTRVELASDMMWHSFDHYGQMVEYLRLNGIIPPASRK